MKDHIVDLINSVEVLFFKSIFYREQKKLTDKKVFITATEIEPMSTSDKILAYIIQTLGAYIKLVIFRMEINYFIEKFIGDRGS